MKKSTARAAGALSAATLMLLGACGTGGGSGDAETSGEPEEISGSITVLTQRTDIVDTVFADYADRFNEVYPDVEVNFEAITDYEGEVTIRMNTEDYGDVLLIPNTVARDQLPLFFEPLGTVDELSADYRFVQEQSFEGNGYGIAITGNASGILYNKRVWAEAGVTEVPTSHEEFIAALHAIADNTDAIPYYTNYADGWPMSQWESLHAFTGDPDADNVLARTDAPWAEGEEHYQIDSLLYDIVAEGLSEPDPLTTNWEESKTLIGSGQVATMVLGSWAIVQMQQAAEDAGFSADDIGYMPFPSQVDGVSYSTIGGDYKQGINVHSDNIPAARAWIEWFTNESGYAFDEGGVSPMVDGPEPTTLGDFEPLGVQYVELNPPPAGEETLLSDIRTTSEIDLGGNVYRQRLVDIARGAADGDMASYFEELNTRWADARAQVG
ncbi:ABC transporter substrate-binding protein [Occultella kanbiaonis]|uniref:ABC transporter substrate-binding protein n=1 Tax=Occultella kanbiaonis TaxID=2675754 RepID=UPI0012B6B30D|nr:extracellular solute-binding protein [Occultella kanbiaonis]